MLMRAMPSTAGAPMVVPPPKDKAEQIILVMRLLQLEANRNGTCVLQATFLNVCTDRALNTPKQQTAWQKHKETAE